MLKALRKISALGMAAVLMLAPLLAACAEGLQKPVEGIVTWPEGASAHQATFLISYQYPQLAPETEADAAINQYYQDMAADLHALAKQAYEEEETQMEIVCEVTHHSARYVSIVQTMIELGGNGERESLSADTFARDGVYAGQPLSLSQVLGLEDTDDLSTAQSVAETLAYDLIWQIIERGMENAESDYLSGITLEDLKHAFFPETDFYLDENGNVVFFIQAGEIAGEIAGILRFPFAPAELLSALQEKEPA